MYIATTDEVSMDPYVDNAQRNWIPPRKRKTLNQTKNQREAFDVSRKSNQCPYSETVGEGECDGPLDKSMKSRMQQRVTSNMMRVKAKELKGKENEDRLYDELPNGRSQSEIRCNPKTDERAVTGTELN